MNFRGVYPILCTPFDDDGELDEPSLRRQVRFCIECGAHGLVTTAYAGEFYTLTDDERRRVLEITAAENDGRLPLVAGCSALGAHHSVMLARHAESAGASAVMAMPPVVSKGSPREIFAYYRSI